MKNILFSTLLVLCSLFPATMWGKAVQVTGLLTEQMVNPMGLDTAEPRFSWRLESSAKNVKQTAYQILVASSMELLNKNDGDLWNSGKVDSDAALWIAYDGKPLKSNQRAYWKVSSYTSKGTTAWSEPASFSVGLWKEAQWRGHWHGLEAAAPADEESQWDRLSSR